MSIEAPEIQEPQPKEKLHLQRAFVELRLMHETPEDVFARLDRDAVARDLTLWRNAESRYGDPTAPLGEHEYAQEGSRPALEYLLTAGIPMARLQSITPLTAEEQEQLPGYQFFQTMVRHEDMATRTGTINFLTSSLFDSYRSAQESDTDSDNHKQKMTIFERKKDLIIPLLRQATASAAERNDRSEIKNIFIGLKNIQADEEAKAFLLDPTMTEEQRLAAAVGYMNAYGFIQGIDTLSHAAKNETIDETLRNQLKILYGRFEGDKIQAIMAELSEVYKAIDFSHYGLNNPELTTQECERIKKVVSAYAERLGISSDQVHKLRLLDIGAGTGRHAIPLHNEGYQVTAFEAEDRHIHYMKDHDPSLDIVQGDWRKLTDTLPTDYHANIAYCLGRTLNHNRTAVEMFQSFDQIQQVLVDNGELVIDQPDIWGIYADRIEALNSNLANLGIETVPNTLIFDGPDQAHRFNRRVLRPDQIEALATILGLQIVSAEDPIIGDEKNIRNVYYHLRKDPDFNPRTISSEKLANAIDTLGLLESGLTPEALNTKVGAWGMSLGQALTSGLDNEDTRESIAKGQWPEAKLVEYGNKLTVETMRKTSVQS